MTLDSGIQDTFSFIKCLTVGLPCYSFYGVLFNLLLIGYTGIGQSTLDGTSKQGYIHGYREVTVKDGLASDDVRAVLSDHTGFIWIATEAGLDRFDGRNFLHFTAEEHGLRSDDIHSISEDGNNRLWVRSGSMGRFYVDIIDLNSLTVSPLESHVRELPPTDFTSLTYGGGWMYMTTDRSDSRIFRINMAWEIELFYNRTLSDIKSDIEVTPDGSVLLSSGLDGNAESRTIYIDPSGVEKAQFPFRASYIGKNRNGNVELAQFQDTHHWIHEIEEGRLISDELFIDEDSQSIQYAEDGSEMLLRDPLTGRYLLITGKEIWMLNGHKEIIGGPGPEIYLKMPGAVFLKPHFDQQGNVWLPTLKHGIIYIYARPRVFRTASKSAVDDPIIIRKLSLNQRPETTDNHVWLANTTIHSFDTEQQQAYRWEVPFEYRLVKATTNDANELMLILQDKTTESLTLYILTPSVGQWTSHPVPDLSPSRSVVSSLLKDSRSLVWIGTYQGEVVVVNTTNTSSESVPPLGSSDFGKLKGNPIYHFAESPDGIWMSTEAGLYLYEEDRGLSQHYSHNSDDRVNIIPKTRALFYTEDGDLWMTSDGYGLGKLDFSNQSFQQFNKTNGLRNDVTYLITQDDKDILWVTNRHGLNQLNVLNGGIRTIQLTDQTSNDVYDEDVKFTEEEQILFSSKHSVLSFYPRDLLGNYNSRVTISRLTELDASTRKYRDLLPEFLTSQRITVDPSQNFLSVDFALLDFCQPLYHQYEYQIEGLDDDWIATGDNTIQLGGLPYGDYRLKVRIANEYGKRANEEINVPLIILKPFYLSPWFIVLALLGVIISIYGLIQWQTSRLRKSRERLRKAVNEQTKQLEDDKLLIENQAEELRQLDQLKSHFFANVSHELRTPLTLLLSPIQTVLKSKELNNRNDSLLRMAQQNGQRLLRLTNEILDLNKLEAGKLGLQIANVVFFNFLKRIIAAFQSHAESLGIELIFQYELDKYLQLKIDEKKTETIIINLLSNAIKFTPPQGQIILKAKDNREHIELSVQDTGRGIHANDLPHIFNRFFQTKQSDSQAEGGTGIGLALSQELAKLMNGSLRAISELGRGSTFTLALPHIEVIGKLPDEDAELVLGDEVPSSIECPTNVDKNETSHTSIASDQEPKAASGIILLVEDNPDLRNYVKSLLGDKYKVSTAENGRAALDYLAASEAPDLIISDIMMPLMDGYQLLEKLKNSEQYRFLPVIMLTALASVDDKLKALRIGVDDYMLKPFSEDELLARVDNLLQRSIWRSNFLAEDQKPSSTNDVSDEDQTLPIELSQSDRIWLEDLEKTTLGKLGDFNFSVEQLAIEMAQSRWQLNRHVKGLTGLTTRQYILETRLNYARTLLESGEYNSVKAITYTVGIKDLQHFSRQFKDRFGKLPSAYL